MKLAYAPRELAAASCANRDVMRRATLCGLGNCMPAGPASRHMISWHHTTKWLETELVPMSPDARASDAVR